MCGQNIEGRARPGALSPPYRGAQGEGALPEVRDWPKGHPAKPCAAAAWAKWLGLVRSFARYANAVDPHLQIPPQGLIAARYRRPRPYIFLTDSEIRRFLVAPRRPDARYRSRRRAARSWLDPCPPEPCDPGLGDRTQFGKMQWFLKRPTTIRPCSAKREPIDGGSYKKWIRSTCGRSLTCHQNTLLVPRCLRVRSRSDGGCPLVAPFSSEVSVPTLADKISGN